MRTGDEPALSAYVPRFQLERMARQGRRPRADVAHAAVVVLDVSGFTRLTDAFDRRGPEGAEALAGALHRYFARVVDIVAAAGGDVVAFAGDAAIVLFAADDGGADGLRKAAAVAARAAVAVQRALAGWEPAPGVVLRSRAGVGAGAVRIVDVGGVGGRWESLVGGDALVQAVTAAAVAGVGEAVASPALVAALGGAARIEARNGGGARLVEVGGVGGAGEVNGELAGAEAHGDARGSRLEGPELRAALVASVPPPVAATAGTARARWMAEFRPVTALFAVLPAMDWPTDEALAGLQAAVSAMQRAIAEHDGAPYQLLTDDKGTTLVAAFGVPPHAASDDATRATAAAMAMRRELGALGVPAGIGVASGRLFTGTFGTEARAHYALRGPAMNLASRLAALAPGDVRCDAATARAAPRIAFERLPAVRVKGLDEPVAVTRPLGAAAGDERASDMIGREAELAVLDDAIEAARAGESGGGGLWAITGEPGIGKSVLTGAMVARAVARDVRVLRGAANAIERATPYFAWRELLAALLDPRADAATAGDVAATVFAEHAEASPERLRAALLGRLAGSPALLARAGVLEAIVPLGLDDTDETRQMDAAARADSVEDLVAFLLGGGGPRLVVLDDAHWLDSASVALARAVLRRVPGLVIVLSSRPLTRARAIAAPAAGQPAAPAPPGGTIERGRADLAALLGSARATIALEPLPVHDVIPLLARRLDAAELADDLVALIMQRTEGRPYFAEELALALRDAGAVAVTRRRAHLVPGAPTLGAATSLGAVLRERLDRLPPREQLVAKTASVIGHVFADDLLVDIHPIDDDRAEIPEALALLQRSDVVRTVSPPPAAEHAFKHVTMQQVAYETLLFAQRHELHRRIAVWYEGHHADLRPFLPLLAHHYRGAEDIARAIDYLERAAEEALRSFSNREAIGFLTEAESLAERHGIAVDDARRARWERRRGEAHVDLAEVGDARGHLLRALALRGVRAPASRASLVGRMIVEVARHLGRRARGWSKSRDRAGDDGPPKTRQAPSGPDDFAASVYHSLSEVFFFRHEQLALLHAVFASLNAAERTGAVRETVNGLGSVGYAAALVGMHGAARSYRDRSLALAEARGTLPVVAFAHQIAATLDNALGDADAADRSCRRAEDIFARLGDRFRWESVVSIHGYTHLARGAFARARDGFTAVLESAGPEGAIQTRAWATAGTILATLPAEPLAPSWIAAARALVAGELAPAERILLLGAVALAERDRGDHAAAETAAAQALATLAATPPSTSYTLWSTAGVADVLIDASPGEPAARAVKILGRTARAVAAGAALAAIARARLADRRGRRAAAARAYRAAIAAADRLAMPHARAVAELGLAATLTGPGAADERAELRAAAIATLERLGAARDAARARAAPEPEHLERP